MSNINFKNSLQNIVPLYFATSGIYYFDKNQKKIGKTTCFDDYIWLVGIEGGKVYQNGESILYVNNSSGTYIVNSKSGEIIGLKKWHLTGNSFSENQEQDRILCYLNFSYENSKLYRDLVYFLQSEDKFISIASHIELNYIFSIGTDNYILFNSSAISKTDERFETLWNFYIEDLPDFKEFNSIKESEVEQYLGIHNDTLWIQLNGERLLGLDIDTGDQKHLLSNIARGVGDNYLDEKTGVIKILAGHHYWEYDLNILEYRKKIALDDEKKWFIRSCNYYPDDPNIYFCGHFDNWDFPNAYGIYDTRKDKITWHHIGQAPEEKYYNPPQANEKIIGILDDSGRLMVYEKNI